ncbi:MAG: Gfo/Idh/MocA family oxidoreductase, partial [Bacteroidetes bacterium]|nr:Gfo/Idh/MocA family oxidoreductase [Bacteroidota bacterium]
MTTRRHFLQTVGLATAGFTFLPSYLRAAAPVKRERIRVGVIGCGLRAQEHLRECTLRSDVEVIALADPDAAMIARSQKTLANGGRKPAVVYGNGNEDYLNLLKRDDIDAVFICSPWEWHIPQG